MSTPERRRALRLQTWSGGVAPSFERLADVDFEQWQLVAPVERLKAVSSLVAGMRDEVAFLGSPPVRIDLLRSADGIEAEAVIERAVRVEVDDLVVPIIAIEDLLANERAAGRPQDLADVAQLERQLARREV